MGIILFTLREATAYRSTVKRLLLWERAYETKIWESGHEVIGRGETPEASQAAAIKRWNEEVGQDNDASAK